MISIVWPVAKFVHTEAADAADANAGNSILSVHSPFLHTIIKGVNNDVDKGQVVESSAYSHEKDCEELMLT